MDQVICALLQEDANRREQIDSKRRIAIRCRNVISIERIVKSNDKPLSLAECKQKVNNKAMDYLDYYQDIFFDVFLFMKTWDGDTFYMFSFEEQCKWTYGNLIYRPTILEERRKNILILLNDYICRDVVNMCVDYLSYIC